MLSIAPDDAAVRVFYDNHEKIIGCVIGSDQGAWHIIEGIQNDPCLRSIIWFIFDFPHSLYPWLLKQPGLDVQLLQTIFYHYLLNYIF